MITVSGIDVEIVRKDIKNFHLAVYPPHGHVRVSAPNHITDDNVRLAVVSRLAWIRKQQKSYENQLRQSERQYVSGECHYQFGKRYRLELIEHETKPKVELLNSGKLKLYVRPNASVDTRDRVLTTWYREKLKSLIPELLEKWQPIVGKEAKDWGVRKMKTKWGSCNTEKGRIWLNLELAKKPIECLEYILVHELIHLHERNHNDLFKQHLERVMPNWKARQRLLNSAPLKHEDWEY